MYCDRKTTQPRDYEGYTRFSPMLLPSGYQNSNTYFCDVLAFLSEHRWMYNFAVTGLLVQGVLDTVPADWAHALLALSNQQLNELPYGFVQESWPQSLRDFCGRCQTLRLPERPLQAPSLEGSPSHDLPKQLCRGLTPKKRHEVSRLATLIHKECLPRGITKILDVGSGLGYLGQVLHHRYGYQVLGLECNVHHVEEATARQQALCSSGGLVSYLTCEVSPVTEEEILQALRERLSVDTCEEGGGVCLVGLHSCGDLSASAAQLFLKHSALRLFIVLPCCYHRMSLSNVRDGQHEDAIAPEGFKHFPQSHSLRRHVNETFTDARSFLRRPFLRLASQETCVRWRQCSKEEHEEHSMNLMARAILYLYVHNAGLALMKKRRRGVRKTQLHTFSATLEDILLRYDFIPKGRSETDAAVVIDARREMTVLWNRYNGLCKLAEAVTGLQMALQAVVESFVLIDKMVYLQENEDSLLSYDVIKVMDDEISPRCHALIARK